MILNIDGVVASVTDLFRSKVLLDEWSGPLTAVGDIAYSFSGRQNTTLLLVRWNANGIAFYKGEPLTDREVNEAFGKGEKMRSSPPIKNTLRTTTVHSL